MRNYSSPCYNTLISEVDPLFSVRQLRSSRSKSPSSNGHHKTESTQILRATSIRTNRKNKFIECILAEDVNIGTRNSIFARTWLKHEFFLVELRKLAWNGIPNDLRPVAWQLLLVRDFDIQCNSTSDSCRAIYLSLVLCERLL